ncbi:MAG TPA: MFS transporter [Chitinophaga sp.]|uniref:MFS transporter n=1 Tax=Chitinophaga sp. TaxID=1869181 RepID=UPI002C173BE1|nr:MFS transporter [Chitinophaga sp.]HVI44208.1 MFS transporter [Chitinophaga sp.]
MNKFTETSMSKWLSLLIVSSAIFLAVIDIFIVNVALPAIKLGINGTNGELQLVIAIYLLGYSCFLITGGRLGDYYGRKKVFITGMLLFTISSCFCGLAQSGLQLNIARFFQGISASLMTPQGVSYIQVLFPEAHERVKAIGVYGIIAGSASVIGQFLGGLLPSLHTALEGWRLVFFINLPIGILALITSAIFLHETPRDTSQRFDYGGVLLLTPALFCLIYPVIQGRELGWPAWSLVMLVASVVLFLLFSRDQRRKVSAGKAPLIDARLFSYRDFRIGLYASIFYFLVQEPYFLITGVYFQDGLRVSSATAGFYFMFQGIGYVIASILSVKLVHRYGKKVLQGGIFIMIIALLLHIFFITTPETSTLTYISILFVYGVGCGSVLPSLLALSLKGIPHQYAGAASGTYYTAQQSSIALGAGIVGGIFFYYIGNTPVPADYLPAYSIAVIVSILLLVAVNVCLYVMPE